MTDISLTLWEVDNPRIRGTQQSSGGVIGAKEEMDKHGWTVNGSTLFYILDPWTPVCAFDNAEETYSDI